MRNYIIIAVASIILTSLIWWHFGKKDVSNDYLITIKEKDSIIELRNNEILKLYKQIKIDSSEYETELKKIQELRSTNHNDAILDSLFIAGYEMR